jgi:hypothetical protein
MRQFGRVIRKCAEARTAERLLASAVEINAHSRVSEEPNVGRPFLEFAYLPWI